MSLVSFKCKVIAAQYHPPNHSIGHDYKPDTHYSYVFQPSGKNMSAFAIVIPGIDHPDLTVGKEYVLSIEPADLMEIT